MGASRYDRELQRLLEHAGAILLRSDGHAVYRLLDGQTYTISSTPSDFRAVRNRVAELRRLLGEPLPKNIKKKSFRRKRKILTLSKGFVMPQYTRPRRKTKKPFPVHNPLLAERLQVALDDQAFQTLCARLQAAGFLQAIGQDEAGCFWQLKLPGCAAVRVRNREAVLRITRGGAICNR
jgi:hypothetical protein